MNNQKNKALSNMGFIGALLIVLLHLKPDTTSDLQHFIVDFVYDKSGFPGVAVSLFFGISGYLLVGHIEKKNWWKTAVKKRLKTLIVPFYLWTFIYLSYKFLLYETSLLSNIPLVTPSPTNNGFFWCLIEGLGLDVFHLTSIVWYLRALFFHVLFSPIIVRIVKKGWHATVLLLLILLFLYQYGAYGLLGNMWIDSFMANGLFIQGALPFAIGIVLRVHPALLHQMKKICQLRPLIGSWCLVVVLGYFTPPL